MIRRLLLFLLGCVLLSGCVIHEFPVDGSVDGAVVELTLNLQFDTDVPQFRTVPYESKAASGVQARYVVALYRYTSVKADSKPDYLSPAYVFAFLEEEMTDRSYTVEVAPANYQVLVWADYVNGSTAYYTSPAFGTKSTDDRYFEVSLAAGDYVGNTPLRQAFYGAQEVRLADIMANRSQESFDVQMERPHARFNFVATDKEEFIAYWATRGTKSFDLTELGVKISYPEYYPSTFNLLQNRPVDARTGVEFDSRVTLQDDGTLDLGYDWVFANADQTVVIVSLSFYDASGRFISTIPNIQVPLCRGQNTTIRGPLLTSGIETGITINPGFEGVFVVPL